MLLKRVLGSFILGLIALTSTAEASEAALRVAFVYKFIKFIEWPAETVATNVNLCVLNPDEEVRTALAPLRIKAADKPAISIIFINEKTTLTLQLDSCHMLYRPNRTTPLALPHPLPHGVVLVADEPDDDETDVSIGLVRSADNRIEFTVNQNAISHAGVNVSSQLLKLAKNMRGGNP